jgi:beta-phosphoglucomutase
VRPLGPGGGLILDMDGVLADSEPLQALAWVVVLARYGILEEPAFFDRWIGIANLATARDAVARWSLPRTPEELIAERAPVYLDLVEERLKPFPGVMERLAALRGVPVAIATSASRAEASRVLRAIGISDQVAAVITADEVTRSKPDPEPYLRAAAAIGRSPGSCVVVEDSPAGVAAARAAGCRVLAVTTTHRAELLGEAHELFASTAAALDAAAERLGLAR